MAIIDSLRLVGSPETNRVMMGELIRLAQRGLHRRPATPRKAGNGALVYPFDAELALLALRYHRTATRLLWDLYTSRAGRLEPLYDELVVDVAGDARAWLWPGAGVSVTARNVSGFAAGSRQIVGTVKNAILDGALERDLAITVDPEAPDLDILVRMHDDELTVSVDLGGGSLSQRGYRTAGASAPLREHLAAVLCMLARHDARTEILVDPMCGSGTICIEAALMARAVPARAVPRLAKSGDAAPAPGGAQPAATTLPVMMRMPVLASQLDSDRVPSTPLFADTQPIIIGNDIDESAYRAALGNARRAGLEGAIHWQAGDFRALSRERVAALAARDPSCEGLILCNPPYGHRLDDNQLRSLYRDLSRWCDSFRGWRAAFLMDHPRWDEWFGREPRVRKTLRNGPLRASFYLYDL